MSIGEKWKLDDILEHIKCDGHCHIVEHLQNGIWTDGTWKKCYYDVQSSIRRRVLNPFLFKQHYDNSVFNRWMLKAGYLLNGAIYDDKFEQKEFICIELFDTFAKHIVEVLYIIKCISDTCVKICELFESLREKSKILLKCTDIEEAGELLNDDFIYMTLMESLHLENDITPVTCLLAYCICFCMFFSDSTSDVHDVLTKEQMADIDKSNLLYIDEKYEEAIQIYNKILKLNHYNGTTYWKRAQAYFFIHKLNEAKIDARRANILEPGWCKPYLIFTNIFEMEMKFHHAHLTATEGLSHCSDLKQCSSKEAFMIKVDYLKSQCPNCKPPDLLSSSEDEDVKDSCEIFSKTESLNIFYYKLKTGSNYMLENKYTNAIENFETALQIAKTLKDHAYFVEEENIFLAKYALGVGHAHSSKEYENLKKALTCFEEIIKNHNCNLFPAFYYTHGLVLVRLFRFEDALEPLNYGLNIVNNIQVLTPYQWPGTNIVINETIKHNLKEKLIELISECRYAPKTDAKCRLESCFFTKNIYYSDPNFKGCYFLYCTGNCRVDYHSQCWKSIRDEKEKTEKDFLDKICMTPDCGNFVYLIEIIGKNGEVFKKLESPVHVKNKTVKHRKTKFEKKTEVRSIKKQKKHVKVKKTLKSDENGGRDSDHESVNCEDGTEDLDKEDEKTLVINNQPLATQAHEENLSSNPVIYGMNSEPAYIFKKEDSPENVDKKQGKIREKKKPKKNAIGIDEFCRDVTIESHNTYLERVQRLQLTKDFVEECDIFCDVMQDLKVVPNQLTTKFEEFVTATNKNLNEEQHVPKKTIHFKSSNITELDNFTSPQMPVSLDRLDYFNDIPNVVYTNDQKCEGASIVSSRETENESSLEYQGTSKYSAYSLDSDNKTLEQIRQKTLKLTKNFNAAVFQLQVTLLALTPDLQIQLVASILNNFSNRSQEFWQKLNDILDIKFSLDGFKDNEMENIQMVNKLLENELAVAMDVNKKLEGDLTNLRDINVKIHKTHSVFNNTKEQEFADLLSKYNDLTKEKKEHRAAYEMEIKRLNFEKQKVENEMKILTNENKSIGEYKERIETLMKSCEEKQCELKRLKDAHEKLTLGSNVLIRQLDEMDIKTKKAMELLIEDRRLLGNMVLKSAIDQTHTMIVNFSSQLKTSNSNSRLEKLNNYLDKIVGIQGEFIRNMSECSKSLRNNEDTFTFDEIPSVPIIPPWSESNPPGFFLPPTNNYLPKMEGQNSLSMAFSNGQTPFFPYMGKHIGLSDIFSSQGVAMSSAFNPNLGGPNKSYDQPTPISFSEKPHSSLTSNSNTTSKAISPEIPPRLRAGLKRIQVPAPFSNQYQGTSYDQPTPIFISKTVPSTSSASTPERTQVKVKSCYDKIVNLIHLKSPDLSEEEIITYIKRYRNEREKCSGKTNDEVACLVTRFIMEERALTNQKTMELRRSKPILRDMAISSTSTQVTELPSAKMWKVSIKESGNFKSQDCSICFEPLSNGMQLYQAECGHNCFHEMCVRPWLKENSTCPICRMYLLLPDEFPEL